MLGSADDSLRLRRALVDKLVRDGLVRSPRVAAAFEAVPREVFVPGVPLEEAYRSSEAIIVKRIDGVGVSSASAPDVVALMLEQLDAQSGMRVLEIGAGTGYNAALLGYLVGDAGRVVTIDIDADLVEGARAHLAAAGVTNVDVVQADGALGYPATDTFDRIMLTVAARDIAPAWREQLAYPNGRLVLPLALRGPQRCTAFVNAEPDCLVSASLRECSFIALRGLLGVDPIRTPIRADGSLAVGESEEAAGVSVEVLAAAVQGPSDLWPVGVRVSPERVRRGLELWLAVRDGAACSLWAPAEGGSALPDLFGQRDHRRTVGLVSRDGVALVAWCDDDSETLCVKAPPDSQALAVRLRERVLAWHAAGQPTDAELQVRAYTRGHAPHPVADQVVLHQRWTSFVLKWHPIF